MRHDPRPTRRLAGPVAGLLAGCGMLLASARAGAQVAPAAGKVPAALTLIPPASPDIRYVGRFERSDANCYRFAWGGCQVQFRFTGPSASVLLEDTASGGPHKVRGTNNNYFEVIVDDRPPVALGLEKGKTAYEVVAGAGAGEHTVTIFRRTEPLFGEVRFRGILLDAGAKLLPPPAAPQRLIEFIGDSITAGYGNEANDQREGFSPATENNYLAYGALTARALHADYVCLAWSGEGVYRNRSEQRDRTLPVLYRRTLPGDANSQWDFAKGYLAGAVVINLGTNDFAKTAPPKDEFLRAYRGLIETVLEHHPGAHVFCCVGPMMQDDFPKDSPGLPTIRAWLTEMVAEYARAGRKNVHYVEFDRQDHANGLGSSYHPSLKTHRIMAEKLTEAIRKETGW